MSRLVIPAVVVFNAVFPFYAIYLAIHRDEPAWLLACFLWVIFP